MPASIRWFKSNPKKTPALSQDDEGTSYIDDTTASEEFPLRPRWRELSLTRKLEDWWFGTQPKTADVERRAKFVTGHTSRISNLG